MKILHVSELYSPTIGGVASFIKESAKGLANDGHEVAILTIAADLPTCFRVMRDETGAFVYRALAVPSPLNPRNNRMAVLPIISATRAILRERPDCIHMHTPVAQVHRIIDIWARVFNIPIVITNHVMPENVTMASGHAAKHAQAIHKVVWRYVINSVNKYTYVVAPTPTALSMLYAHGLRQPGQAITNGVNADYYTPGAPSHTVLQRFGLTTTGPKILYVGRLDGEKRADILIAAMPAIVRMQPTAQLILVGRGTQQAALAAQAQMLGVAKQVVFTGFVTDAEKRALLRAATVFAIASPAELQCIAALEAMACGLPLVTADAAALVEICKDGKNGYQFSYPNSEDFAQKVLKLLSDEPLRKVMAAASRTIAIEQHSRQISVGQYVRVYKKAILLAQARKRRRSVVTNQVS